MLKNEVWVKFSDETMSRIWDLAKAMNWPLSRTVRVLVLSALDEKIVPMPAMEVPNE